VLIEKIVALTPRKLYPLNRVWGATKVPKISGLPAGAQLISPIDGSTAKRASARHSRVWRGSLHNDEEIIMKENATMDFRKCTESSAEMLLRITAAHDFSHAASGPKK
jgi:hypothetical protein